jgi:hypothetical protein
MVHSVLTSFDINQNFAESDTQTIKLVPNVVRFSEANLNSLQRLCKIAHYHHSVDFGLFIGLTRVRTENLSPDISVMKSAKDRA